MKRILLSTITLMAFGFSTNAQNVNIPDANFKAYLVGNTSINTNMDTEIQVSEANAFTGAINCWAQGISDLTGIETFISITELACSNNSLASLDVTQNTALTSLWCNGNTLTSLDVTQNTAITSLRCELNALTSLDVSQNTALTSLKCNDNSLSALDVSNNTALTELNCYYNALSALDVSSNTSLISLGCWANSISVLDISSNTALVSLSCGDNLLSVLDVSNNNALIDLTCGDNLLSALDVSSNTSLVTLGCQDNSISTLDLNNNTALVYFGCGNNSLSVLDLSANNQLEEFTCHGNLLTTLNIANGSNVNIYQFSSINNPNLTCIQVDDVAWSTTNWTNIDAGASFSLDCGSCTVNIPDANFKNYLVGNTAININGDAEIQCSEASAFSDFISCNGLSISDLTGIEAFTSLDALYSNTNQLTSLDLSQNTLLTTLECENNLLSNINVAQNLQLIEFKSNNNQLTSLDISQNSALVTFRCSNNLLTSLDYTNNPLLSWISCANNSIASLDITQNTAVTAVNVQGNLLVSLDVSQNTNVTEILCYDNQLTTLNVANGNNNNVGSSSFAADSNPNLTCIQVDNIAYSTTNWTNVDAGASFSLDCNGGVGIEELEKDKIVVYPNPASSQITIQSDYKIEQVKVFNSIGSLVQTEYSESFSVENLPIGVYVMNIITKDRIIRSRFVRD